MDQSSALFVKLQTYLSGLSPQAQSMLVRTIEGARAKGEATPIQEIIMEAMRNLVRGDQTKIKRKLTLERAFYEPFDLLIVSEQSSEKHLGRIDRGSLSVIWTWLKKTLGSEHFEDELNEMANLAAEEKDDELRATMKNFRKDFAEEAIERLQENEDKFGNLNKIASQLGNMRALEDLQDILKMIAFEDTLVKALGHIEQKIPNNKEGLHIIHSVMSVAHTLPRDQLIYIIAALLPRVEEIAQLIKYTVAVTKTHDVEKIRTSNMYAFIDLVIAETERTIKLVNHYLKVKRDVRKALMYIERYHTMMRCMEADLEGNHDDELMERIAQSKASMSSIIEPEIQSVAKIINRVLRAGRTKNGQETLLDQSQIMDATEGVRILLKCKKCSDQLALNKIIGDNMKGVETAVDTLSERALEDFAKANEETMPARKLRAEAALQLADLVFAGDFAKLLHNRYAMISGKALQQDLTEISA